MKKFKSMLCTILAASMLLTLFVAGNVFADPNVSTASGGLNGVSGNWSNFNYSVYDHKADDKGAENFKVIIPSMKAGTYKWPSNGTMLIQVMNAGSKGLSYCNGITVPAGLKIDIYASNPYKKGLEYILLAHIDTTNGQPYTINAERQLSNVEKANQAAKDNMGAMPYKVAPNKDWNDVTHVITPGKPLTSYSHSFVDVPKDHPNYDAIMLLTENGVFQALENGKLAGCAANEFKPDDVLTRGQIDTALLRLRGGTPSVVNNWDAKVNNSLYQEPSTMLWTAIEFRAVMTSSNRVTLTSNELNLLGETPLLDQLHKFTLIDKNKFDAITYDMWRANLASNKQISYKNALTDFADYNDIITQFDKELTALTAVHRANNQVTLTEQNKNDLKNRILIAWNMGVINNSDGKLHPSDTLTRGEFCQLLYDAGLTYCGINNYSPTWSAEDYMNPEYLK